MKRAFSKSSPRSASSSTNMLEAIFAEWPDLAGQAFQNPERGNSAHTVIFPEANAVIKGPLTKDDISLFEQEYRFLQHVTHPAAPRVKYIGQQSFLYRMTRTPGIILALDTMTEDQRKTLAHDIADFMHGVARDFTPEDAKKIITEREHGAYWGADHISRTFKNLLLRRHLQNVLPEVEIRVEEYFARERKPEDNVAFHNDLNNSNILIDPDSKKLTGIIDFGYVHYGPLDQTLGNMLFCFPLTFVKEISKEYESMGGTEIRNQDILLSYMMISLDRLHYSLEENNSNRIPWFKKNLFNSLKELRLLRQQDSKLQVNSPVR